jgi:hypothetical protein
LLIITFLVKVFPVIPVLKTSSEIKPIVESKTLKNEKS